MCDAWKTNGACAEDVCDKGPNVLTGGANAGAELMFVSKEIWVAPSATWPPLTTREGGGGGGEGAAWETVIGGGGGEERTT